MTSTAPAANAPDTPLVALADVTSATPPTAHDHAWSSQGFFRANVAPRPFVAMQTLAALGLLLAVFLPWVKAGNLATFAGSQANSGAVTLATVGALVLSATQLVAPATASWRRWLGAANALLGGLVTAYAINDYIVVQQAVKKMDAALATTAQELAGNPFAGMFQPLVRSMAESARPTVEAGLWIGLGAALVLVVFGVMSTLRIAGSDSR